MKVMWLQLTGENLPAANSRLGSPKMVFPSTLGP
jgi:hypothetical protein